MDQPQPPSPRTPPVRSQPVLPHRRTAPAAAPTSTGGRGRRAVRLAAVASAAVACVPLAVPRPAAAGATLASRQSDVRTSGSPVGDVTHSATDFDTMAENVGTADGPVGGRDVFAHQYSVVGRLGDSGAGLEGAFGEGEARAAGGGVTSAESRLELAFHVDRVPSAYTIGGSVGAGGGGSAVVMLSPILDGSVGSPLFAMKAGADDGAQQMESSGFLAPGDYLLHVRADGQDRAGGAAENSGYYSFNFTLANAGVGGGPGTGTGGGGDPGTDPPAAVPLPPAALTGGALVGLLFGARAWGRRRLRAA